jgi:hypothetical protein
MGNFLTYLSTRRSYYDHCQSRVLTEIVRFDLRGASPDRYVAMPEGPHPPDA